MRPYLFRGLLALLVALVFSAPAAAQSVIRGKVVDAQGKPVEGASVTIEATESSRRAQVKTNRNGEFMQIGLPSGRYNVTAVKDNLKQMQTANISQGMPVELSFQLTPTSGMTPEQAKAQAQAQAETQAMAQQAIEAMRAGRDDEAIQKFNEIVAKIPTCSDCYYNLGVAYSKKQQYAEAEASFTKATSWLRTTPTLTRASRTSTTHRRSLTRRSRPAPRRRSWLELAAAAEVRKPSTTRA